MDIISSAMSHSWQGPINRSQLILDNMFSKLCNCFHLPVLFHFRERAGWGHSGFWERTSKVVVFKCSKKHLFFQKK